MSITMPKIDIIFKQLATSAINRSERGYAILIIKDDTDTTSWVEYKETTEVADDSSKYTADNLQAINDAFLFGTYRVCVARITGEETVTDALKIIESNISTGWIAYPEGTTEDQQAIATWIKTKESKKKTFKAIVYKATTTDCKHVVNFVNANVTYADTRGKVAGNKYLATLVGILAYCNITKGCTYFKCTDLSSVDAVDDNDTELEKGNFILFNDTNYVRIAQGINSLITLDGENATEDMQFIETVEAMDIIQDDITDVFKESYLGPYKNKLDNQMLFISAINGYLKELAEENVLDPEYDNVVSINIEAQRQAWVTSGKTEAADWTDAQVKIKTFKRDVFLKGDIKILGSMTNLKFNISLF